MIIYKEGEPLADLNTHLTSDNGQPQSVEVRALDPAPGGS